MLCYRAVHFMGLYECSELSQSLCPFGALRRSIILRHTDTLTYLLSLLAYLLTNIPFVQSVSFSLILKYVYVYIITRSLLVKILTSSEFITYTLPASPPSKKVIKNSRLGLRGDRITTYSSKSGPIAFSVLTLGVYLNILVVWRSG